MGRAQVVNLWCFVPNCGLFMLCGLGQVPWKRAAERVRLPSAQGTDASMLELSCLGLQLKVGGKFHRRLNIGGRPIANKYHEGKMQRAT